MYVHSKKLTETINHNTAKIHDSVSYLFLSNVSQNFARSSGDLVELFAKFVILLLLTNLLQAFKEYIQYVVQ